MKIGRVEKRTSDAYGVGTSMGVHVEASDALVVPLGALLQLRCEIRCSGPPATVVRRLADACERTDYSILASLWLACVTGLRYLGSKCVFEVDEASEAR